MSIKHDDIIHVTLFTDGPVEEAGLLYDTHGHGLIDCGCTKTVCGKAWLDSYLESLPRSDHMMIEYLKGDTKFRFGDSPVITSTDKVILPIKLGPKKFSLETCIVPSDVPLLISRSSLERADATIGFGSKEIWIGDEQVPVVEFKSGHMGVSLISRDIKQSVKQILKMQIFGWVNFDE